MEETAKPLTEQELCDTLDWARSTGRRDQIERLVSEVRATRVTVPEPSQEEMKERVLTSIDDLGINLLDYDRRDDEELPPGAIEAMIAAGGLTIEEMVSRFDKRLRELL